MAGITHGSIHGGPHRKRQFKLPGLFTLFRMRPGSLTLRLPRPANLTRLFSYAVMGGIVLAVLLPLVPIVIWAFGFRWFYPDLLPAQFSLRAWEYVFSPASRAGEAALTGGAIAAAATVLSLLVGIPAGRALGMHNFPGKRLVQFLILAPVIVPGMAVVMGIHVAFIWLGLSATALGVTLAHLIGTIPYVVMVMSSVFANYRPEFEEQARTLGADPVRTFIYVTFPAIRPGVLVAGMFAFIISWGQYIVTLLVSGGRIITVPLLLVNFAAGNNNSVTAALCLVFVAPSILILILTSKYLTGESAALGGFGGMTQVRLQRLNKVFPGSEGVHAVKNLNLEIPSGRITVLLGPSGCGKTTTLKMIAGLLPPSGGDITFDGKSVLDVPAEKTGRGYGLPELSVVSLYDGWGKCCLWPADAACRQENQAEESGRHAQAGAAARL